MKNELLQQFEEAVFTTDTAKIISLIEQGVPVDTKLPINNPEPKHPLYWLLGMEGEEIKVYMKDIGYKTDMISKVSMGGKYRAQAFDSTKVLLERGLKLFEKDNHNEGKNFIVDDIVCSQNTRALTEVALCTIEQTLDAGMKCYEFFNLNFYDKLYENYIQTPDDDAFDSNLEFILDKSDDLYKHVSSRLMSPTGTKDKSIKRKYEASKNTYWTSDADIPDVEEVRTEMFRRNEEQYNQGNQLVPVKQVSGKKKFIIGEDISIQKMTPADKANEKSKCRVYILPEEAPQAVLEDLDSLIGLEKEKKSFLKWATGIMKNDPEDPEEHIGYSSALLGNPGTGKSTLFRLKARFLHSLGLVGDRYVEATAADIVGKYVGHTRPQTRSVLEEGDVIFLDEAYGLYGEGKNSFGKEAVDEIVAYTENNRHKPLFFAGYEGDMKKLYEMNDGLSRRIRSTEIIQDYSFEDLGKMFDQGVLIRGYKGVEEGVKELLMDDLKIYKEEVSSKKFGNAGEIRNALDDLSEIIKERIYELNKDTSSDGSKLSLVEKFNRMAEKKIVKKKDMMITVADIEALNIAEKHKSIVDKTFEHKKAGFGASNDDNKSNSRPKPKAELKIEMAGI